MKKPIIITVEGNIGSGKTTLCKELESVVFDKPHKIIYEDVEEWCKHKDEFGKNIFELYYSDKQKYSYLFQSYVLCSRVSFIYNCIKKYPDHVLICERSHLTDFYIFATILHSLKLMSEIEFKIYNELFKTIELNITGTVYNKVNTDICIERIKKRNRLGEKITEEYIKQLNDSHDEWLLLNKNDSNKNLNLLIIDGSVEKTDTLKRKNEINNIIEFVNQIIKSDAN